MESFALKAKLRTPLVVIAAIKKMNWTPPQSRRTLSSYKQQAVADQVRRPVPDLRIDAAL
jgi:hypothetical protein